LSETIYIKPEIAQDAFERAYGYDHKPSEEIEGFTVSHIQDPHFPRHSDNLVGLFVIKRDSDGKLFGCKCSAYSPDYGPVHITLYNGQEVVEFHEVVTAVVPTTVYGFADSLSADPQSDYFNPIWDYEGTTNA
jgi:hypothetical protein